MGVADWFKRVFSGSGRDDDESAEREEYNVPDHGAEALRADPTEALTGLEPPVVGGGELEKPPDLAP